MPGDMKRVNGVQPRMVVELHDVTFDYGKNGAAGKGQSRNTRTIERFSMSVAAGSFTTLLGPSGCGKTTLLRLIAGFLRPLAGEIHIEGVDQKNIPPEKRMCGIVFQDYALFPHLSVAGNLEYGLRVRRVGRAERREKAEKMALTLGITGLLDRYPAELSGGQAQRVALGRALLLKPAVLLMDEPFSSIDAKLRRSLRAELLDTQRALGVTTIFVTHDQEEALSLSDHIAVIRDGRLEQFGEPEHIYNEPYSAFTADFTGAANFLTSRDMPGITYMARPEWLEAGTDKGLFSLHTVVESAEFLGKSRRVYAVPDAGQKYASQKPLILDVPCDMPSFAAGEKLTVAVKKLHPVHET
jgi:ABC-type Fe3+/spermidine/putrescine transport system ATPase subunit